MTAVAVELCACGHAERLHALDSDAEQGRGECARHSCGCSEYRPRPVTADVPDEPVVVGPGGEVPSNSVVIVDAPPVEPVATAPAALFRCPECPSEFTTKQGLGGHLSRPHRKPGTAVVTPVAAVPTKFAAGPQAGEESGAASRFDPGPSPAASTDVEVPADDVLIGLVRALDKAIPADDAASLLEQAFEIRDFMAARGWRVIEGSQP